MESRTPESHASLRASIVQRIGPQVLDVQAAHSLDESLQMLAEQTRLLIGAHQCAISFVPLGDFQAARHAISLSDKYARYNSYDVMPTGQGIWSLVLSQKVAVRMTAEELVAHPLWKDFSDLKDSRGLEHPPMRGWLTAPVVRPNGEVLGLLQLSDKLEDAEFTSEDLDWLVHLANMVTPTFELHYVNLELQRRTEELRLGRDQLEARVRERTAELTRSNQSLQEQVEQRRLVERREHDRADVLEQLAKGLGLPVVLESIVRLVELETRDALGSILLLDKHGKTLLHGAAPRLPDSYNRAIHGLAIGPEVGSCGSAAFTGQRVIVEDIETHPYWTAARELARQAGLRACWSEPILSSAGQVLGTFAVYHAEARAPSPGELEQISGAAYLASIAIERARREEALHEKTALLQAVVEGSPEVIFAKDHQRRVTLANPAYLALLQRSAEEVLGLDESALVSDPELARVIRDNEERVLMTGRPLVFEMLRGLPGAQRLYHSTLAPLRDPSGQVAGLLGVLHDITARKLAEEERSRLESQLLHAQKLESLGVLAGGIAHDFNNLLTSILGYADLAQMELPAGSSAKQLIGEAVHGARQAADLTKQMLAYSGKGRFVVEALDLTRLIEEMTRLMQVSISKKCVLKFDFMPDLPAIEGDSTQVRQVIMNLITNASEAIGDRSGVIAIATGVMHCDRAYLTETYLDPGLAEGLYVFLEVADTGCGMSEETKARIFDPFFTTKFTGRGLGLSAALGIVRGHRGAFKTYSEIGKGTTIKVLFPASRLLASAEVGASPAPDAWRGSGTVLVVDDEESVRGMARHMLQTMGFDVLTAGDGREAVEIARREGERIRLVLLDLTMPHLDGEETFREIRRIRSGIRVVLTSGYNEQSATSRFVGKGLAAFLQKPFRFEDLLEVVRGALAKGDAS